jgi:hypothetical protein
MCLRMCVCACVRVGVCALCDPRLARSGMPKHEKRVAEKLQSIFKKTVDEGDPRDPSTSIARLQGTVGALGHRFYSPDSQFAFPLKFVCR